MVSGRDWVTIPWIGILWVVAFLSIELMQDNKEVSNDSQVYVSARGTGSSSWPR